VKQSLSLIIAAVLMVAMAACTAPASVPEITPEPIAALPEGLSGYPFELADTTYALWCAVCSQLSDGGAEYEIRVLQIGNKAPIQFSMGSNGKLNPKSCLDMRLIMPDGSTVSTTGISFFATDEAAGYSAATGFTFRLASGQALPDKALMYRSDIDAQIEVDLSNLIIVDAAVETAAAQEQPAEEPAIESAAAPVIPEELVGAWTGTGEPVGGGSAISLDVLVNADGTGSYTFEQAGYVESYPFTLTNETESFCVDIPADNRLGISACEGTYLYADNALTLHITTTFASGRQFEYTASCTKAD
jgi:hypothetical protein